MSRDYLQKQRECLWTLRKLIIKGKLQAYKYWGNDIELRNNRNRGTIKVSLLDYIPEYEAEALPHELAEYFIGDADLNLDNIIRRFLTVDEKKLKQLCLIDPYLARHENHLNDLNRLRQFAEHPAHNADAFHVWVCELNKIEYFVTADRKIKRYFADTLRIKTNVKIVDPTELLSLLNEPILKLPGEKIPFAMSVFDLDD